jgi:quercetin dioxygenase-like cupin family protein
MQTPFVQTQPTIVPPHGNPTVPVFGIPVEILLTGEQTGGACSAYRVHVEPGDGPLPHIHRNEDEAFYVLNGEFEILCGEHVSTVSTGTFVFLPRNIVHTFRNVGTSTGCLLGIGTPPGHEKFFEDASRLSMPPDPAEAMSVCLKHGIELMPPTGAPPSA